MSNFDDFDPLEHAAGVRLRYVAEAASLGQPDLVILPGTKTTVADLQHLRRTGLAVAILERARQGTPVVGVCGGYQMLGQRIRDPLHVESTHDEVEGLGLLPLVTTFAATKRTCRVRGQVLASGGMLEDATGLEVAGYEIHMGHTQGSAPSLLRLTERSGRRVRAHDGAADPTGQVFGTYLHGIFHNDAFRRAVLGRLARDRQLALTHQGPCFSQDEQYDRLAALVRQNLDIPFVYHLLGLP